MSVHDSLSDMETFGRPLCENTWHCRYHNMGFSIQRKTYKILVEEIQLRDCLKVKDGRIILWKISGKEVLRVWTEFKLNPWRQNPKVHHRIHNSLPPAPFMSQLNPLHHTPVSQYSPRSILIPSSHLRLSLLSGLFPSSFPIKTFYTFLYLPCVPHALLTSSSLTWSVNWIKLAKSQNVSSIQPVVSRLHYRFPISDSLITKANAETEYC
jgi:hypothetical protein